MQHLFWRRGYTGGRGQVRPLCKKGPFYRSVSTNVPHCGLKSEKINTTKHAPVYVRSCLKIIGTNTLFQYVCVFFRQVDYAAECSDFKDHFIGNKTLCNGDFEQTG